MNPAHNSATVKLVVAALLAAGLVACSKEEAKPAASAAPAEPSVTVTIGHAGPLTVKTPHLGKDDENGVALAISQANDQKLKIGGKLVKFVMISEDDQGDPKIGTTVATKLLDAKVVAVIGHLNSGVSIPASEIYSKAGIPMISGSATNPELTNRGLANTFRTVGRDDQQGPAIATYIANEIKAKNVALIDDKTAYGEGLANEVEKTLKADKVTILGRERTTDTESDFKSILTKIKAKNPDVVFHGGMDQTGGPLLKQARELGIKAIFVFGDGACTNEMFTLAKEAANGLVCSQAGLPAAAASKEFLVDFNKKYGDVKQYAPYYYDATRALIEAMKKADSVDPAKFGPELFKVSFIGATGKVEFDAKGDRKDADITIFKMSDGKIAPVSVIRNGVASKFEMAPAAVPATETKPTDAKPAEAKPAEAPKK
jgi:branched-chain amino acid transport system substrate-binding protein